MLDTNYLVAETLKCSATLAQPLSELIYNKAKGNPFFVTQFLVALYKEGHISFNCERRYWECDMSQIAHLSLTEDVVAFMVQQLQKLTAETQNLLKLAACIGNQFDLATLAIVSQQSPAEVATTMWQALQEGLLLPTSQVYKFFQSSEDLETQNDLNPTYRFLHDRVQQAAYCLISSSQKQSTHLQIGRLLLQEAPPETLNDRIYTIVSQLNVGAILISDRSERQKLAQLNLQAGRKAKLSTAYASACGYLATGIELLSADSWSSQYELTLNLYLEQAETLYLNGDFEDSDTLIARILTEAKSAIEKAQVYNLRIVQYTMLGRYEDAIRVGKHILALLDIDISEDNASSELEAELEDVRLRLKDREILSLLEAPFMADPLQGMVVKLLANLGASAYFKDKALYELIGVKIVNLSLQYGHIEESVRGYYIYSVLLASMDEHQAGYQFGLLAFQLSKKLNSQAQKCKACNGLNHLTHWVKPMREMMPTCEEGFQAGLESGEIQFAGYILMHKTYIPFSQGGNLANLLNDSHPFLQFCQKANNQVAADTIQGMQLLLSNLTGQTDSPTHFAVKGQTEAEYFLICRSRSSAYAVCRYLIAKAQILYLYERPADGLACIEESNKFFDSIAGNISIVEHNFYHSLCLAALYQGFSHEGQELCLKQLHHNQTPLKVWAESCPENYLHKYLIIEAEIARLSGQTTTAIEQYEKAIANAHAEGFIQDEAIAYERLAKLYLEADREEMAQKHLIEAYYGYARWGAKAKTDDLAQRYPKLLQPILQQVAQPAKAFNPLETIIASQLAIHTSTRANPQTGRTSTTNINTSLDFTAVLKASQVLSGTIELEDLLCQLTQIILQNSGGDRCALILVDTGGTWQLKALATPSNTDLCSDPLEGHPKLPLKLIQYVKNTQKTVVVDNLETELPVIDDFLEKSHPQSLLCLPLLNQGKLLGILYLRNRKTGGAFTQERVHVLEFLCAQAAISLENAGLYQQSQAYAEQLEQSQLQTVQTEKMASLGNLVAGVAHEINNPIGFLNGSVKNAKNYVKDLQSQLEIYQQHYPDPVDPVQENAEDIDLDFLLEDFPKLLDSMTAANQRIKSISTSLRTFSRADTEHTVSANLHEGLDSTLLILKYRLKGNEHRPEIKVVKNYGALPVIDCFPGQLNQVFMNLLANAIDIFDEAADQSSFAALKDTPQIITVKTEIGN